MSIPAYFPAIFTKDGRTQESRSWRDHFELVWDGWKILGSAPELPTPGFVTRGELAAFETDPDVALFRDRLEAFVIALAGEGGTGEPPVGDLSAYLRNRIDRTPSNSTGDPGVRWRTNFVGTLEVALSNIVEHYIGSKLVSWQNEWGAIRGRNPYGTWADSLVRAIIDSGDFSGSGSLLNSGNAFELVNRTIPASGISQQVWGIRWLDGRTVRNGNLMNDVYVLPSASTPPPASLPAGTVLFAFDDGSAL